MGDSFQFRFPVQVVFGAGRLGELGRLLDPAWERVLLVSDRPLAEKTPLVDKVRAQLAGREVECYFDIVENPDFTCVEDGAAMARRARSQAVVAVGGGSAMDGGKGIALCLGNDAALSAIVGGAARPRPALPVVCLPTTAGTGSEVTPYAVFTDRRAGNKRGFANDSLYPRLALVDPELTFGMPPPLVVDTGLDALTHAVEAYLSRLSFPFSDCICLQVIEKVVANLPPAARRDRPAMVEMAYAAMAAGIAISLAGTILLHVQAYPLTVFHGIPHGRANAVLLPRFLDFLRRRGEAREKLARLDGLFAASGGAAGFVAALGIGTDLRAYGVGPEEIPGFVAKTMAKSDVPLTPAPVGEADIAAIYGLS